MENSWVRLVRAAGLEHEEDRRIVGRLVSLLGEAVGDNPNQTITNWRVRGRISAEGALAAQAAIKIDANWLITGQGAMTTSWPFSRVDLARVKSLNPEDLAYVEGRLASALETVEVVAIPHADSPSTSARKGVPDRFPGEISTSTGRGSKGNTGAVNRPAAVPPKGSRKRA